MNISNALQGASKEAGWSPARVAAEAGVTEGAARRWVIGSSLPAGAALLALMRKLPGFAQRLGFREAA